MAIIKYRVEARMTRVDNDDWCDTIASEWQYEEVKHPEQGGQLMDRDEAQERIKELGLVQVFSSMYGAVYDYPDEPFWQQFHTYYGRRRRNGRL